jgi:PEGA domain-containing protein
MSTRTLTIVTVAAALVLGGSTVRAQHRGGGQGRGGGSHGGGVAHGGTVGHAVPRAVYPVHGGGGHVAVASPYYQSYYYRPYYSFHPHFSIGFGFSVGYPVVYPYYGFSASYGYPYPYAYPPPYAYGYPAPAYPYPPAYAPPYPPGGYAPYGSQAPGYPPYGSQAPGYSPNGSQAPGYAPYGSSAPGYAPRAPMSNTVSAQAGGQAPSGVSFEVTPANAAIFVDGTYVGAVSQFGPSSAPLRLTPGRHHVELRASGYKAFAFETDVTAGQITPFQGTLQVLQGH